uniref:Uncharacterized protein n=1 Tax=Octactis speculum TaxID=3111310 RepID=A0A7S2DLL1_9STRA|mmetsp:Transcript_51020/g.69486  ORF Transcript_51020/g.69486 Transcript_51020/m.69486 type:complete len:156 (+) Transcript_51020:37-504(+)
MVQTKTEFHLFNRLHDDHDQRFSKVGAASTPPPPVQDRIRSSLQAPPPTTTDRHLSATDRHLSANVKLLVLCWSCATEPFEPRSDDDEGGNKTGLLRRKGGGGFGTRAHVGGGLWKQPDFFTFPCGILPTTACHDVNRARTTVVVVVVGVGSSSI